MSTLYHELYDLYPVSKTLRFELKPVGKTKENIEKNGILAKDEERAIKYKKVKIYCNEYHKDFIERALSGFSLNTNLLNKYYELFNIHNKDKKQRDELINIQSHLRKEISDRFTKDPKFKNEYIGLNGKDLTDNYLVNMYKSDKEKLKDIMEFKTFSTYFSDFRKNRENMYVADEKSTAIAYRLINENLPIFISNMEIYLKIREKIKNEIDIISSQLGKYIKAGSIDDIFKLDYFNNVLTQKGIDEYNTIISGNVMGDGTKIKGLNEYINEYNQIQVDRKKCIPKFRELYKQILSDRNSTSFLIDKIEDYKELLDMIMEYYQEFLKQVNVNNRENLLNLLQNIDNYKLDKIYINNDSSLTDVSAKVYGDWSKIKRSLINYYDENYEGKKKKNTVGYFEERDKYLKNKKQFSIEEIEKSISLEDSDEDTNLINYIKNLKK